MDYIKLAEERLASYLGVKHALLTSMGRSAIVIALKAVGVGYGDDVIIPSFACEVVARAVEFCGANPTFADVSPLTFNISAQEIANSVTENTQAIVAIHCYGQPADMDKILEIAKNNNIPLIEDVAHSLGADYHGKKAGNFGNLSIFSFSKNMNCTSGGAVVTNSIELISKAEEVLKTLSATENPIGRIKHLTKRKFLSLRRKQSSLFSFLRVQNIARLNAARKFSHYVSDRIPEVFRADNKVAVEVVKGLSGIDSENRKRRYNAEILTEVISGLNINGVEPPFEMKDRKHVYYIYALKVNERDKVLKNLQKTAKGIYWSLPWQCPYGYEATRLSKHLILAELKPDLTEKYLRLMASALASAFKS